MEDETLTTDRPFEVQKAPVARWGLAVSWCPDEPHRVGETLVLQSREAELGRGAGQGARLEPWRIRPGASELRPPLATRRISRRQLVVRAGARLSVSNVGKTKMFVGGRAVDSAQLSPGESLELENAMVLTAVSRVVEPPDLADAYPSFPFGEADPYGMVGESEAAWELRAEVAFVARRTGHVLIAGPSGAGKELVGAAVHALSGRPNWVARNVATIPESLAQAELFGNRKDYPNPGMPERAGLVGEAGDGTLLLDEFGELPLSVQAGLLRLLDNGDYQRLGESRSRSAGLRMLGATNRDLKELKHDLVARFRHTVRVPGLGERPEDVGLIATHLTRLAAEKDAHVARFLEHGWPRFTPAFVLGLVGTDWSTHARELDQALWEAMSSTRATYLDAPRVLAPQAATAPQSLSRDDIVSGLAACDGVVSRAWKHLGLRSRDQLRRLMRKHNL